ncbi:hypothetical protein D9M72_516250 [compost metagenome]
MHRTAGHQLARRGGRQPHLLLGAQQDDVGQRRLDGIANAAGAVGGGHRLPCVRCRGWRGGGRWRDGGIGGIRLAPQVAQVRGIDGQVAGKGTAQRLVRGDQRAQPLVDLPVLAFAALLHGLHDQQPDAHADQRDDGQAHHRGEQALPGTEIQVSHVQSPSVTGTVGGYSAV